MKKKIKKEPIKKEPITVSKKTIDTIEGLELFTTPAAAKVFQSWAKKEGVNVAIRDIQHYFRYGLTPKSPPVMKQFEDILNQLLDKLDRESQQKMPAQNEQVQQSQRSQQSTRTESDKQRLRKQLEKARPASIASRKKSRAKRVAVEEKKLKDLYYNSKQFFGRDKLYKIAQNKGINMSRRDVMNWLKKQNLNQVYAGTRKTSDIQPTVLKRPRSQLGVDLIDMSNFAINGYKWIFTGVDMFSKKMYAVPMKGKDTLLAYNALSTMMKSVAPPQPLFSVIRSDNGSEFIGTLNTLYDNKIKGAKDWLTKTYGSQMKFRDPPFKEEENPKTKEKRRIYQYASATKFRWVFSSAYTPQSNGMVERANGTLKRLIMKSMKAGQIKQTKISPKEARNWVKAMPILVANYNNSVHDVTKKTPNELDTMQPDARPISTPSSAYKGSDTKKQVTVQETIRNKALKGRKGIQTRYKVGQYVRVKKDEDDLKDTAALNTNWSKDVYRITKVQGGSTEKTLLQARYTVRGKNDKQPPNRAKVFYYNDLQPVDNDKIENKIEDYDVFELSKLMDPFTRKGIKYYMVQWKHLRKPSDRTQETRKYLMSQFPKAVGTYERTKPVDWKTVPKKPPAYAVLYQDEVDDTPEDEQDTPVRVLTRRGTRGSGVKPNDYLTGPYVMLWKSGEITVQKFADTIDAVQKYMKDIKTRRGKIRAQKLRRWQFEQEKVETTDGKGGRLKYEKQFGPLKEWMAKKGNEGVTKIPK